MAESKKMIPGPRRKRRNRWAFPLGLAIIALALVGTATLLSFGVTEIKNLTNQTALKAKYEEFLLPVVMNDPDPFDDLSKANMSQLLDSSIQMLLNSDKKPGEDEYVEVDSPEGGKVLMMLIKKDDVDLYFEKLFGNDISPDHMSVSGGSLDFDYDKVQGVYYVPITTSLQVYLPHVYSIDKKGDSIILSVDYIKSNSSNPEEQVNLDLAVPNKRMKITLRVTEGTQSYYVSAIQDTDASEIADLTTKPNKDKSTTTTTTEPETTVIQSSTTEEKTTVKDKTSKGTTTKSTTVKSKTAGN